MNWTQAKSVFRPRTIAERIAQQLEINQIAASLGYAQRPPQSDIWEAIKIARRENV